MTYKEALDYIHSVSNYFCKPGLERVKKLCEALGNPQDKLKFVHVAGTNGKGSFCSMLSSVLIENGLNVGTYTSPYILEFNERIAVNGKSIENDELAEICDIVKSITDGMDDKPTEFEIITAIGFEYFYRKNCDIVVLECGLGGRFDATNIINTPILSVITGVDFDHTNFLGNTIEEIAFEKAGIVKKNIPCLWCGDNNDAKKIIKEACFTAGAPFVTCDNTDFSITNSTLSGTHFKYKQFENIFIPFLSLYQPINAINVINAVNVLNSLNYNLNDEALLNGLAKATWKARFEKISDAPLIIFDGAHNPQGVKESIKSIQHYFPSQKVNILTGVMADKDYNFIASQICKVANCVFCITASNPRALEAEKYAKIFTDKGIKASAYKTVQEALDDAISNSNKNDTPLICLGSLYMYGDIIKHLK